ncbi:peptidoglycan-binding protein [Streptomyces sp. NPDC020965]|uniref:peptidoglycan-binding protein n=1 Tax=Streptomyces sp. NPDC020965 TaxID=3365105 RepID=UPI00379CE7CC
MTMPVFEEYEPAPDCDCPGCVQRRRDLVAGAQLTVQGRLRAMALFTAAGVVLGGGTGASPAGAAEVAGAPGAGAAGAIGGFGATTHGATTHGATARGSVAPGSVGPGSVGPGSVGSRAAAHGSVGLGAGRPESASLAAAPGADPEDHEQGGTGPLHGRPLPGPSGTPAPAPLPKTTRAEIINRAKKWVAVKVPYSMQKFWSDGYRQDCSGYVSMVWNLPGNEWTGTLARYATKITRSQLQPGDMLLFHNPANPTKGSHVTVFGGWIDHTHTSYTAYEQAKPHTLKRATPMAYWSNSERYVPYRYKGLTTSATSGAASIEAYPGASAFGPGANNRYITKLGEMLVERGGKRFYASGPGPRWGEADRKATEAFQRAQGWRGTLADGRPGPETWRLLVTGKGKSIPSVGTAGPGGVAAVAPPYPGREHFRPGASSASVTRLGQQLVKRGYGRHYTTGPGPRWSEADRRNTEEFQHAQGWRGAAADGRPGPETWRRLFDERAGRSR